jgi:hypothetical protein
VREIHGQNRGTNSASPSELSGSFLDGFGEEIHKKLQPNPGALVPNGPVSTQLWIESGWTIKNNKGMPVRDYPPFLAAIHDFGFGASIFASSTLFYNPLARVFATLHPDRSGEEVTFDLQEQCSCDANDIGLMAVLLWTGMSASIFSCRDGRRRLPNAHYDTFQLHGTFLSDLTHDRLLSGSDAPVKRHDPRYVVIAKETRWGILAAYQDNIAAP